MGKHNGRGGACAQVCSVLISLLCSIYTPRVQNVVHIKEQNKIAGSYRSSSVFVNRLTVQKCLSDKYYLDLIGKGPAVNGLDVICITPGNSRNYQYHLVGQDIAFRYRSQQLMRETTIIIERRRDDQGKGVWIHMLFVSSCHA